MGQAIADAVSSAADRQACVVAAEETAYAQSGLNVMVYNMQQAFDFSYSEEDLKFFETTTCDGITFGVWAFCQGTFTKHGDGGYINWAWRGDFTRDPPDGDVVVFNNVCPTPEVVSEPTPTDATCTYTIQAGDTLANIAAARGVSVDAITQANGISNPDAIFAGQSEAAGPEVEPVDLVFFPALAFLVGLLLETVSGFLPPRLLAAFPVPYTGLMLLLGLGIGAWNNTGATVPSSACSATFFCWHWYLLPYSWSWAESWLFGAILSAIDPVAVVALISSVGASELLSTLIDGESLLNDGVAFVLFTVFLDWVTGKLGSPAEVFAFVCKASFGGPALGIAFGLALAAWLALLFASPLLSSSGILSLVFLGLSMAAYGSGFVSRQAVQAMSIFWKWAEWTANTLIFFLSGVIIADVVMNTSTVQGVDWGWSVAVWALLIPIRALGLLLLFPALRQRTKVAIYAVTWRDLAVMSWAGLRGGVGLVLALFVFNDPSIASVQYRELVIFFVGSTVVYSALGYTKLSVAKRTVMLRAAEAVEAYGAEVQASCKAGHYNPLPHADWDRADQLTDLHLQELVHQRPGPGSGHGSSAGHKGERRVTTASMADLESGGRNWQQRDQQAGQQAGEQAAQQAVQLAAQAPAEDEGPEGEGVFAHIFQAELLTATEADDLLEACDEALDATGQELAAWKCLQARLQLPLPVYNHVQRWVGRQLRLPLLERQGRAGLLRRAAAEVNAFLQAYRLAQQLLQGLLRRRTAAASDGGHDNAAQRQDSAGRQRSSYSFQDMPLQPRENQEQQQQLLRAAVRLLAPVPVPAEWRQALGSVLGEVEAQVEAAQSFYEQLQAGNPHALGMLETHQAAMLLADEKSAFLQNLLGAGLLEGKEVKAVVQQLERRQKRLYIRRRLRLSIAAHGGAHAVMAGAGEKDVVLDSPVNIDIDPLAMGQAIADAVSSAADRQACVVAAEETAYAQSGLNVMVYNMQQAFDFSYSEEDLKFFETTTCDGITFGVWAFCQGTFTKHGDGGYINWAWRGDFTRDPPDGDVVVFNNVCPTPEVVTEPTPTDATCTYTIQAGDTLANIAAARGVSVDAITQANGISNPDAIFAGQVVSIPGATSC
ncbi:Sodium/hydrogen exchanger 7 [Chlorella vulgaris]